MRQFAAPLSTDSRAQLLARVEQLVRQASERQEIAAAEYILEPAAAIAVDEVNLTLPGGAVRLATSRAEFRPPFEWLAEITLEMDEDTYLRHYLVRDDDVVWALRRNLVVIDDAEAAGIMATLQSL